MKDERRRVWNAQANVKLIPNLKLCSNADQSSTALTATKNTWEGDERWKKKRVKRSNWRETKISKCRWARSLQHRLAYSLTGALTAILGWHDHTAMRRLHATIAICSCQAIPPRPSLLLTMFAWKLSDFALCFAKGQCLEVSILQWFLQQTILTWHSLTISDYATLLSLIPNRSFWRSVQRHACAEVNYDCFALKASSACSGYTINSLTVLYATNYPKVAVSSIRFSRKISDTVTPECWSLRGHFYSHLDTWEKILRRSSRRYPDQSQAQQQPRFWQKLAIQHA